MVHGAVEAGLQCLIEVHVFPDHTRSFFVPWILTLDFNFLWCIFLIKWHFDVKNGVLLAFSLTVKAAPHECVIRTSQP